MSPEENVIELGKVNYRSLSFSHFVVYRLYHYPAIVIAFLTLLLALLNINGPFIGALNPVQETVFIPREKNFARVLDAWNNKYHGEALPSSSNEPLNLYSLVSFFIRISDEAYITIQSQYTTRYTHNVVRV